MKGIKKLLATLALGLFCSVVSCSAVPQSRVPKKTSQSQAKFDVTKQEFDRLIKNAPEYIPLLLKKKMRETMIIACRVKTWENYKSIVYGDSGVNKIIFRRLKDLLMNIKRGRTFSHEQIWDENGNVTPKAVGLVIDKMKNWKINFDTTITNQLFDSTSILESLKTGKNDKFPNSTSSASNALPEFSFPIFVSQNMKFNPNFSYSSVFEPQNIKFNNPSNSNTSSSTVLNSTSSTSDALPKFSFFIRVPKNMNSNPLNPETSSSSFLNSPSSASNTLPI